MTHFFVRNLRRTRLCFLPWLGAAVVLVILASCPPHTCINGSTMSGSTRLRLCSGYHPAGLPEICIGTREVQTRREPSAGKRSERAGGTLAVLLAGLALVCAAFGRGEEGPSGRHERVLHFLKTTAAELSERSLSDVQTLESWNRDRPVIRRQLLSMLGLEPLPERTPLQVRITGTLDRPTYLVEKVVFQSSPGLYVTGNLYVPHAASAPLPAILYACGHSPHPRGAKWDYQDRAIWFAEHGTVCFVLDTLEFGEVPGIHHGIHDLNMWDWLATGYTPIGVEVWNAIRALDYLESRPEVDARRIGMTGISGGGAATWYTAAADERIASAAPICSTFTFGSQAKHWAAAGQCDCIYYHNTYLTDFPIVGALIAPRPLLICGGQKDSIFPPDGTDEVYRRVRRIYDLFAAPNRGPERIRVVSDNAGHADTPLFRMETRAWMSRWLKDDETPVALEPNPTGHRETEDDLACLRELPVDAVNYKIHDSFIPAAVCKPPRSLEAWRNRSRQLAQELKESVFRWFPDETIPFLTRDSENDGGWAARYARYKEFLFDSETGVPVRVQLLSPKDDSKGSPLLIYVKRPGDSIYFLDMDELLPLLGRYTVLILNCRLTEQSMSAYEFAEIERTASWIGRTVAGMQIWDILRAVEWSVHEAKLTTDSISLYGKGDMGVLSIYAALFDPRIKQVVLRDPPISHRSGAALLNVLRITDIPEVAGALAPRRLVFLREIPAAFELTRRVYELNGCPDQIACAGSLPEALEVWKH